MRSSAEQWPIAFFSSLRQEKKSRVKTTICESTSRQAEYSSEERAEQQEERPRDIAIRLSRKAPETRRSWPPTRCCWSNPFWNNIRSISSSLEPHSSAC